MNPTSINRFGFLGAAGAMTAVAGTGAASAQASPPVPAVTSSPTQRRRASQFFSDPAMNFVYEGVLGSAYFGLTDVGTLLAIVDQTEDGNSSSAFNALTSYGARSLAAADAARIAGHRVSARSQYLQASNYLFAATYFCDGMGAPEKIVPTWKGSRAAFDSAMQLTPHVEHVKVAYQGTTLPGYFWSVDGSRKPRPLFIMTNGSDGSILDMYGAAGATAALERGYDVLAVDGPGQGAALWLQGLHFRPDWEAVITPTVDFALRRPDVDPKRLVLQGISQGGYWVPRAVAFEHRIAAAVADPGVYNVWTSWYRFLPPPLISLLDSGNKTAFDQAMTQTPPKVMADLTFRARPYGFSSLFDVFMAVRQYTMAGIASKIRCPMFVADPENEQFWPGQPKQLSDALRVPKVLVPFTMAEGADGHCEPLAPGLRAERVFDWLDRTLGKR